MPSSLRRALMVLLFLAAVSGWAVAGHLGLGLISSAGSADSALSAIASNYVIQHLAAEAEGGRFERVEPLLRGAALETLRTEKALGAAAIHGLALLGTPEPVVLWRSGPQALVEVDYKITSDAAGEQRIGEHLLMSFVGEKWLIEQTWRIVPDPGTPLIPLDPGTPLTSPSPETPLSPPSDTPPGG